VVGAPNILDGIGGSAKRGSFDERQSDSPAPTSVLECSVADDGQAGSTWESVRVCTNAGNVNAIVRAPEAVLVAVAEGARQAGLAGAWQAGKQVLVAVVGSSTQISPIQQYVTSCMMSKDIHSSTSCGYVSAFHWTFH
jgi:hypothetical protein